MAREFINSDVGEFGFNQFHVLKDNTWKLIDLEVDCDEMTIKNFRQNDDLIFQFWVNDTKTRFCMASNFRGHKRQVEMPQDMLKRLKVTFTEPAKGGGEFDLSIDNPVYRGEIVSGTINVSRNKNGWDHQDYEYKRKTLENIIGNILRLTGGIVTKTTEYVNA